MRTMLKPVLTLLFMLHFNNAIAVMEYKLHICDPINLGLSSIIDEYDSGKTEINNLSIYLDSIHKEYKKEIQSCEQKIGLLIALVIVLSLLLIVSIIYISILYKKIRKSPVATTDRVVLCEEYIGGFLDISLQFIQRLDDFQRLVKRKVLVGQSTDLLKDNFLDREKDEDELFRKFDQTFLGLFPTFIAELNELFKPDERISYKEGTPLNTELRILALYRLGIVNSHKIASFLQYSLRTIYNYRSQIRKRLLDEEMDLESEIKRIGRRGI